MSLYTWISIYLVLNVVILQHQKHMMKQNYIVSMNAILIYLQLYQKMILISQNILLMQTMVMSVSGACVDFWVHSHPRCSDKGGFNCSVFYGNTGLMDNNINCDAKLPFLCSITDDCALSTTMSTTMPSLIKTTINQKTKEPLSTNIISTATPKTTLPFETSQIYPNPSTSTSATPKTTLLFETSQIYPNPSTLTSATPKTTLSFPTINNPTTYNPT
eukprot:407723_1